jgi:tetratricopeptide (TPR) repeat protein
MRARSAVISLVLAMLCFCAFGQTYESAFNHARDLLKQKQYAQALDEVRQSIHLDNSRWEAWYVAGTASVGLEKYDLAIDYFQEALNRAPEQAKPTIDQAIATCHQILSNKVTSPSAPTYPIQSAQSESRSPGNDLPEVAQFSVGSMPRKSRVPRPRNPPRWGW